MNKLFNKFLILLIVVLTSLGLYLYFSNGIKSEAANTTDGGLSSSSNQTTTAPTEMEQRIADDTSFISTLMSLNGIKIDTSLFSDKSFTKLNDNNVKIAVDTVGRSNPFAVISDGGSSAQPVVSIVTNEATQVTDKTAILNGTVNDSSATGTYFEYGASDTLGKTTNQSKQSMIGGISALITGLTSKTTYYFRSVAKISGTLVYGETISFTTN